jgi:hypothetical protein
MSDRLEVIKDNSQIMPFKKIKEIVGRNEYIPTFLNDKNEEDFISPILLVELYIPNISKFQIHLVDKRNFIFKACFAPNITKFKKEEVINKINKELKQILKEKLMNKVKYKIEIVDHLWADPKTGKFRLITKA